MEIGKPDETGAVGEEVTRALRMFSEKSENAAFRGTFYAVLPMTVGVVAGCYNTYVIPLLLSMVGGRSGDWEGIGLGLLMVCLFLAEGVSNRRRAKIGVELQRSHPAQAPFSCDVYPQIWAGRTLFARAVAPFLAFWIGMVILWVLFTSPNNEIRAFFVLIMCGCFYFVATRVESLFHPLLGLEVDGIQVLSHKVLWSQIERVSISRHLHNEKAILWQFFDEQGAKLAAVSMDDKWSRSSHFDAIAIALGRALNAKVSVMAPVPHV